MANVLFKKGLLANLPSTHAEGTFYVTTDERAIYLDVSDSARIRLGDFQEFATLEALQANTNPSTSALYYVTDINCLAKWDGSKYVQINLDTGVTSVEVTGSGNAVTSASYNATTRKLTLTMGETFATRTYVGEIPADKGTNIIEYINKKAEETLNAAQGGSSETAASVAQALQNYKDLTDPRLAALEEVDHEHANKDVIDGITAQNITDWNDAVAKEHEHGNKSVIDGITAEKVAEWDDKQVSGDYATKTEAQGYANAKDEAIAAAKKAGDDAQADVDALEQYVGTFTAIGEETTVVGYIDAKIGAIPAQTDYSVTVTESSPEGYAKAYTFTQLGSEVAVINIPKDMVVESGSVVTNPEGQAEGTYIKLVLANAAEDELFINVGDLIEYVTGGTAADGMITVNVDANHVATATINDGTVTLAKLHVDVQAAIGKAHEHANKTVLDGISAEKVANWDDAVAKEHEHTNKALLDTYTQTEANLADAVAKKHEHANKAELDLIASGDKAKWDAAAADAAAVKTDYLKAADKTELEGKISAAQTAAEKVANDNNTAMDTRVKALEAIDHEAYKGYADQAETDAVATANAYTDAALTWGSF